MTLFKPTLAIRRLCIVKDNRVVFNSTFHNGVNIIRGHNSSGKTTILDFIAYTLGSEYIPWKQEALLCDWSIAEVLLNGKAVTLRRAINNKPLNPLYICWSSFEEAVDAPLDAWEIFGFKRSGSKLSFTQALLLALDLPEAQGDGASNLTMHQLLRVLYSDQPSLHSPIFRADTFDSALNRETVGAYLTGVYDDNLYLSQLEKRELEKEVQLLDAELRSIFKVLAKSEQNIGVDIIGQEIQNLKDKRDKAVTELTRLRLERTVSDEFKRTGSDSNLRMELDIAKRRLVETLDQISRAETDLADSVSFITELESRLRSLDESGTTRNYFGRLSFTLCPSCLCEIKRSEISGSECGLCKNKLNVAAADAQVLRMRNELRIQLQESKSLISEREVELRNLRSILPELRQNFQALENRYLASNTSWSSQLETAIEEEARKIGGLEQEIKGLFETQRLADAIHQLQVKREEFVGRINELDSRIESLIYLQETRKQKIQSEVASTLGRLLREDLNRQAEFSNAANVQFSFTDNLISVEGSTKFSESSTVVLRHLFHLALLSTSTRIPEMRMPRFLILDGIEDGGMELERSHRLQEIIVEECSRFECDYQVIFATSQISPKLENDAYVVARQFSENSRSLDIR